MNIKNKKAAMEMSVGTIVTIVLLMAVLVLGLVLIQNIFGSATDAIDVVDNQIQGEISEIFQDEGVTLVIYPTSREITLDKDENTPKGFAFAIRNDGVEEEIYSYTVVAEDVSKCGSAFTEEDAEDLLLGGAGSYNLGSGEDTVSNKDIIKFTLNENVPLCTMVYRLHICKGIDECQVRNSDESSTIFVTIK